MQIAINFHVAILSLYSYVVFGHETETYLAWLERLRQYCFWMT